MKQKGIYGKAALTAILTVCAILIFYDTFFGSRTLIALLKKLLDALTPILLGSLFAYLLSPVINFFDRLLFPAAEHLQAQYLAQPVGEGERHTAYAVLRFVRSVDHRPAAHLVGDRLEIPLKLLPDGERQT